MEILYLIIAQITCICSDPRWPSSVVLDANGKCIYWYYNDEPDKRNPCHELDYRGLLTEAEAQIMAILEKDCERKQRQ